MQLILVLYNVTHPMGKDSVVVVLHTIIMQRGVLSDLIVRGIKARDGLISNDQGVLRC